MVELVFKNMITIRLEKENIIEFDFDDLVEVNEGDLVVTNLKMTICSNNEILDYIGKSQIASFFYKGTQYYVNYEDGGYVGGPNIKQTMIRKDNKLYIRVK